MRTQQNHEVVLLTASFSTHQRPSAPSLLRNEALALGASIATAAEMGTGQ
jgi:hypothetical protein